MPAPIITILQRTIRIHKDTLVYYFYSGKESPMDWTIARMFDDVKQSELIPFSDEIELRYKDNLIELLNPTDQDVVYQFTHKSEANHPPANCRLIPHNAGWFPKGAAGVWPPADPDQLGEVMLVSKWALQKLLNHRHPHLGQGINWGLKYYPFEDPTLPDGYAEFERPLVFTEERAILWRDRHAVSSLDTAMRWIYRQPPT